jgi:hypothetical protein
VYNDAVSAAEDEKYRRMVRNFEKRESERRHLWFEFSSTDKTHEKP